MHEANGKAWPTMVTERDRIWCEALREGGSAWLQSVLSDLKEAYGEDGKAGVAERARG